MLQRGPRLDFELALLVDVAISCKCWDQHHKLPAVTNVANAKVTLYLRKVKRTEAWSSERSSTRRTGEES